MTVLRNLARNLWNAIETRSAAQTPEAGAKTLHAVREQRVPAVLGLGRFRDGFDKLPAPGGAVRTAVPAGTFRPTFAPAQLRRDGFDSVRRAPVDLSGGTARPQAKGDSKAPSRVPNFSASLDQLAALAA
ncbi:MAG: hypothetical protein QM817_00905 [Archangium sp.]